MTLATDMARLRLSLESLTKSELLLFRANCGRFSPADLDGWRAFQSLLETIGGVMAMRHDTNPEPGRSNTMPFPDPDEAA